MVSNPIINGKDRGWGFIYHSIYKKVNYHQHVFNAGVLDPEELSVVNKGFENSERNLYPQTEAKVWRSAESSSTITSDGFSLASLELDLFDDLKSSSHKSSRSSRVAAASSKSVRENGLQNTQCEHTHFLLTYAV